MLLNFRRLGRRDYQKANNYAEYAETLPPRGCTLHDLGQSSDPTKNVYGVTYGALDGSKPVLYLEGVIHGAHEWQGAHYLRDFMSMIANPHGTPLQEFILELTQHFDIYTIPCVNPYGYEKNTYENANGVNLNRNFDFNYTAENGSGDTPFSEPESKIIKQVVEQYRPFLFVDYHTLGGHEGFVVASGSDDHNGYRRSTEEARQALIYNVPITPARNNGSSSNPTSRSWAAGITSSLGVKPMTFLSECGSLESNEDQSTFNLYSTFLFCAYALNWHKNRTLQITGQII